MEKKYCPINSHPKSDGMCKKEKCAWWIGKTHPLDTAKEGCAILRIGRKIESIISLDGR